MIPIIKGPEPDGLRKLREEAANKHLSPSHAYKELGKKPNLKKKVREQLTKEQGGLCAYCMCRIPPGPEKEAVLRAADIAPVVIEHVFPRNPVDHRDIGQGLDYGNLVAVCHGNRASASEHHHLVDLTCDAHRQNTEFKKVNPCDATTLESIEYGYDGTIKSSDDAVFQDLNSTLNLNYLQLKAARKAALDALTDDIGRNAEHSDSNAMHRYCRKKLDEFRNEPNEKTPYVGILIWYLESFHP